MQLLFLELEDVFDVPKRFRYSLFVVKFLLCALHVFLCSAMFLSTWYQSWVARCIQERTASDYSTSKARQDIVAKLEFRQQVTAAILNLVIGVGFVPISVVLATSVDCSRIDGVRR